MSPKQQQYEVTLPTTTDVEKAYPCRLATDSGTSAAAVMYVMSPKLQQNEVTLPTATTDLEKGYPCQLTTDTVQHSTAAVVAKKKKAKATAAVKYA